MRPCRSVSDEAAQGSPPGTRPPGTEINGSLEQTLINVHKAFIVVIVFQKCGGIATNLCNTPPCLLHFF
ncbi:hypothetical protein AEA09_17195 [Lysinibacillus contaminans]|uniref:Uncharacterized protein n=1 Tax=Lysinibacillus contaminans TaxID=1293441 RepID=A0ABR5JWE6_9BACI|nr:hypothetical protein AEA09_17195 [Lysinibacillus contaminans]